MQRTRDLFVERLVGFGGANALAGVVDPVARS